MFVAAWFITAKKWKECECPSVDEWVIWSVHTLEWLPAIKRNGVQTLTMAWTDLENNRLREEAAEMILFRWNFQNKQIHGNRLDPWLPGTEEGRWGLTPNGCEVSFEVMKFMVMTAQLFEYTKTIGLYILKGWLLWLVLRCPPKASWAHRSWGGASGRWLDNGCVILDSGRLITGSVHWLV